MLRLLRRRQAVCILGGLAVCSAWLSAAGEANAASCTKTQTTIDFGNIDPTPADPYRIETTGTFDVTCTGMAANSTILLCPALGRGPFQLSAGSRTLRPDLNAQHVPYELWIDSARTRKWGGPNYSLSDDVPSKRVTADGSGNAQTSFTVYASASPDRYLAPVAGPMTARFPAEDDVLYYVQSPVDDTCAFNNRFPPSSTTVVTGNIMSTCRISDFPAPQLNFGSIIGGGREVDAQGSLTVYCTRNLQVLMALDGGREGSIMNRKMRSGSETIGYQIYLDAARTRILGDGVEGAQMPFTGSDALTIYGRADVAMPTAGTYTDTVVITLTY